MSLFETVSFRTVERTIMCVVYLQIELNFVFELTQYHHSIPIFRMVDAKIAYVLGLLVHGKVVVEFGRKIFLVDFLL